MVPMVMVTTCPVRLACCKPCHSAPVSLMWTAGLGSSKISSLRPPDMKADCKATLQIDSIGDYDACHPLCPISFCTACGMEYSECHATGRRTPLVHGHTIEDCIHCVQKVRSSRFLERALHVNDLICGIRPSFTVKMLQFHTTWIKSQPEV